MINFVTGVKDKNKEFIQFPDNIDKIITESGGKFFELYDRNYDLIVKEIDNCDKVENTVGYYKSSITGAPVNFSYLSSGAKAVLTVYYLLKSGQYCNKVVDITCCGNNAVTYLTKIGNNLPDIDVSIEHFGFALDSEDFGIRCKFNGKETTLYNVRHILEGELI